LKISFAAVFRVSSTPIPWTAVASWKGRPSGLRRALRMATGSAVARSLLLYWRTMGSPGSRPFAIKFPRRFSRLSRFASIKAACESATKTTASAPLRTMRRVES